MFSDKIENGNLDKYNDAGGLLIRIVLPFLYSVLISIIFIVMIDVSYLYAFKSNLSDFDNGKINYYISFVLFCSIFCFFLYKKNVNYLRGELISSTKSMSMSRIFLSIGCAALIFFISSIPDALIHGWARGFHLKFGEKADISIISIAIYCVFIPIIEEMCFRGIIFDILLSKNTIYKSMIICTLFFSLFHTYILLGGLSYAFELIGISMLGFFACVLRVRFGSILYPIVLHSTYNLLCNIQ